MPVVCGNPPPPPPPSPPPYKQTTASSMCSRQQCGTRAHWTHSFTSHCSMCSRQLCRTRANWTHSFTWTLLLPCAPDSCTGPEPTGPTHSHELCCFRVLQTAVGAGPSHSHELCCFCVLQPAVQDQSPLHPLIHMHSRSLKNFMSLHTSMILCIAGFPLVRVQCTLAVLLS